MNMLKLAVNGAAGRVGIRILTCAQQDPNVGVVGALEGPDSPAIGKTIGELIGQAAGGATVVSDLATAVQDAHCVIDFSHHTSSIERLEQAAALGKALVVGTTGYTVEERARLLSLSTQVPLVWAANYSTGVNLLFYLVEKVADVLREGYDIEIVEQHHRFKTDAPSGTALRIAEVIANVLDRDLKDVARYGRHGETGMRSQEEIGISSIRAGDCVGTHTVYFGTMGEQLELTHRASSRDTFAQGALRAAKFAVASPPGLYDMQAVLGLNAE